MARILGLCFALLFASSVSAANIIDLGPSDYRNWGTGTNSHTGAGIRSSTGQTVRLPPLNGNLNVNRNAVIPYGSIANGMRQFTRINPASVAASAAVTGLFLAVDWVYDQATGEWVKEEFQITDEIVGDFYWTIGTDGTQHASAEAACEWFPNQPPPVCNGCVPGSGQLVGFENGGRTAQCLLTIRGGGGNYNTISRAQRTGADTCPVGYVYYPAVGGCGAMVALPISEQQWSDLEASLPDRPANEVAQAGNDAMKRQGAPLPGFQDQTITGPSSVSGPETTSTSTDPVTGDTIVTTTNTTTNINYGDTTITTTNTTTSTTYQNGQETGTTVTTETPGELPTSTGTASGDWPAFCDWATVVCDWFNWTQEEPPPEQDLPVPIDEDFFEYKEISFGVKSCPPDYEINLSPFMDRVVGVSFQPLCDFAAIIYFMVMAASYIIAAYISIGVARSA